MYVHFGQGNMCAKTRALLYIISYPIHGRANFSSSHSVPHVEEQTFPLQKNHSMTIRNFGKR